VADTARATALIREQSLEQVAQVTRDAARVFFKGFP
jgi:hypothetical protein